MAFTMRVAVAVMGLARAAQSRIGFARSPCAAAHVTCQWSLKRDRYNPHHASRDVAIVRHLSLLMLLTQCVDNGHVQEVCDLQGRGAHPQACLGLGNGVELAVAAQLHLGPEAADEGAVRHALLGEVLELVQDDLAMHHHKALHSIRLHGTLRNGFKAIVAQHAGREASDKGRSGPALHQKSPCSEPGNLPMQHQRA